MFSDFHRVRSQVLIKHNCPLELFCISKWIAREHHGVSCQHSLCVLDLDAESRACLLLAQAVDIKKQASAVDLLDDAVWYYDPVSGRNLWGNRSAAVVCNRVPCS